MDKVKIRKKSNFFGKILKNKKCFAKGAPKRFRLNGNTVGFLSEMEKLEWRIISP